MKIRMTASLFLTSPTLLLIIGGDSLSKTVVELDMLEFLNCKILSSSSGGNYIKCRLDYKTLDSICNHTFLKELDSFFPLKDEL